MNALKYTMIDFMRCKTQMVAVLILSVVAYMFARDNSFLSGMSYLLFAAMIIHGTNFTQEQRNESGFVNLLPGLDRERVAGRIFTGIGYLAIVMLVAFFFWVQLRLEGVIGTIHIMECILIFSGIGMMVISLQSVMFYMIGKGNNLQIASLINMLPGFLLYMVMTIMTNAYERKPQFVQKAMSLVFENITLTSFIIFFVGVVVTCICIYLAHIIVTRKDFV